MNSAPLAECNIQEILFINNFISSAQAGDNSSNNEELEIL